VKIGEQRTYFDEEKQIGILAFGGGSVALLDMMESEVDTLTILYENIQQRTKQLAHHGCSRPKCCILFESGA